MQIWRIQKKSGKERKTEGIKDGWAERIERTEGIRGEEQSE